MTVQLPPIQWRNWLLACFAAGLLFLLPVISNDAFADDPPPPQPIEVGTCTSASAYRIDYAPLGGGLFSTIQKTIEKYILDGTNQIFNGIVGTPDAPNNIHKAVQAAATLYIAIYGILFMFGMIQVTAFDLMVRLAKIGVVAMFLSSPWDTFNATFYHFFYDGMKEIIGTMLQSALGGLYDPQQGPFTYMDDAAAMLISPKMAATLIAAFTTGPYGIGIGLVILMSLVSFVKSMLEAMWVYVAATIMMLFMFSLAPLFIPCILFDRTRSLFDGWMNQIVNAMLQPIFLFAFFSFFVILFESCLNQLFNVPVCWTPISGALKGAPFEESFWRFAIWDCSAGNGGSWVPFDGIWDFNGPQDNQDHTQAGCPQVTHPVGIVLPLTLWIISDIASRFNDVVVQVAMDISNGATDLRLGIQQVASQLGGAFGGAGEGGSKQAGGASAGNRAPTGGGGGSGKGGAAGGGKSSPPALIGNRGGLKG